VFRCTFSQAIVCRCVTSQPWRPNTHSTEPCTYQQQTGTRVTRREVLGLTLLYFLTSPCGERDVKAGESTETLVEAKSMELVHIRGAFASAWRRAVKDWVEINKVSLWFLFLSEHWHLRLVQCVIIQQEDIVLLKGDLSLSIFSDILFVRLIRFRRRKKLEGTNSCYGLLLLTNGNSKSTFLVLGRMPLWARESNKHWNIRRENIWITEKIYFQRH